MFLNKKRFYDQFCILFKIINITEVIDTKWSFLKHLLFAIATNCCYTAENCTAGENNESVQMTFFARHVR